MDGVTSAAHRERKTREEGRTRSARPRVEL